MSNELILYQDNETVKKNARLLIFFGLIAIWVWFRFIESSVLEPQPVVRHRPPPAERYEPRRYRPGQPGMDVPALPEIHYDVSKITSSITSTSDVRPDIQISEIFYHPTDTQGQDAEFIELHHTGDARLNMGGWSFTQGIEFVFPEETLLAPGETVIICKDRKHFRQSFGEAPRLIGACE